MKKMIRALSKRRGLILTGFGLYITVLLYFLFLSGDFGRNEIFLSYRYNLVPFKEIMRYIHRFEAFGFLRVFINLAGNILAFIPFGFLFPLCFKKKRRMITTLLSGLLFVVLIEFLQVVTRVGCYDVDDIILNMTGIFIGSLFYAYSVK